jgi:hypothetical protein
MRSTDVLYDIIAEWEEPSQLGGDLMAFGESGDLSNNAINELLQRNAYTYPCADRTLRDRAMHPERMEFRYGSEL